jgi:hypothetical protein
MAFRSNLWDSDGERSIGDDCETDADCAGYAVLCELESVCACRWSLQMTGNVCEDLTRRSIFPVVCVYYAVLVLVPCVIYSCYVLLVERYFAHVNRESSQMRPVLIFTAISAMLLFCASLLEAIGVFAALQFDLERVVVVFQASSGVCAVVAALRMSMLWIDVARAAARGRTKAGGLFGSTRKFIKV